MSSPTISTDQNAKDVIRDLATADAEQAQAVLTEESAKEQPRSTVVEAAEARLAELEPVTKAEEAAPGAAPVDSIPEGAWSQLLDENGEPVLVDGKPVAVDLVP